MKKLVRFINHAHKSTPLMFTISTMRIEVVRREGAIEDERKGMKEKEKKDKGTNTMTMELLKSDRD